MKKSLILAILLTATGAMADLRLSLQSNFYDEGARPQFGMNYHSSFLGHFGTNVWMGFGSKPQSAGEPDYYYYGVKPELQLYLRSITLSAGVSLKHETSLDWETTPYLKATWTIKD